MGRPRHTPTDEKTEMVEVMVLGGYLQAEIADALGIAQNTLRLYYKEQLQRRKSETTVRACKNMFNAIEEGDWQATKFWLQTRGGFVQQVGHNDGSEKPIGKAIFPNMVASEEEWEKEAKNES